MGNACSGTHGLHFPGVQFFSMPHGIGMFQYASQWNGDNFHVVVGVRAEAHARRHPIVIPHPETAKMNSVWIVPIGKRKRVIGL
jgi:hypothetical protein